jgi:hypothetical protein
MARKITNSGFSEMIKALARPGKEERATRIELA